MSTSERGAVCGHRHQPAHARRAAGAHHNQLDVLTELESAALLQRMYVFLDDELETASCAEIRQHLDECAPCLEIYDVERVVKQMVHRCCGDEHAPDSLRDKVRLRITEIRLEIRTTE